MGSWTTEEPSKIFDHISPTVAIMHLCLKINLYFIDFSCLVSSTFSYMKNQKSKKNKTKIVVTTDASPGETGGFCLINGVTPDPLKYFPRLEMCESFEKPTDLYHYQRRQDHDWHRTKSSTYFPHRISRPLPL